MILRQTLIAAIAAACVAPSAHAAVVISEVLYNEVGSNTAGEFIEIYNNGTVAVDLSNYKIGDEEVNNAAEAAPESGGMLQFPTGTSISPGQTLTIAAGAATFFANYNKLPDFEALDTDPNVPTLNAYTAWDKDGGTFNMSNSNDQALLLDGSDGIVDTVGWGNTFAFNPGLGATVGDGQSYFRTDVLADTDTAADFTLTAAAPDGAVWTTRSSPGSVTVAVPEPAGLALFGLAAAAGLRRRR